MRLMDMVAQATHPTLVRDELGRTFLSSAVVEAASAVRACPVRYILDAASSAQCRDLVREAHELFRPEDPLLRLPAEAFWLEWFNDPDESGIAGRPEHRTGLLVEADGRGRRGRLRIFGPGTTPRRPAGAPCCSTWTRRSTCRHIQGPGPASCTGNSII